MVQMLESEEAARRLGVKLPTLYAYVSRGLLHAERSPDGRRSLFALDDVERLGQRSRRGGRSETRVATVTTGVCQVREDGPAYRGVPAVGLATRATFEEVTALLWESGPLTFPSHRAPKPPSLAARDRLRWAAVMAGATEPLRADLRPQAVRRAGAVLVASAVGALGPDPAAPLPELHLEDGRAVPGTLAARLAGRLVAAPSAAVVRAVNAALVLLADHELATSTLAVRVAASTRADPYDAVLAGLGTLGGPLHGGASEVVVELLATAVARGAAPALDSALRWQRLVPGFGHGLYPAGDPRAVVLLRLVDGLAGPAERKVVHTVIEVARTQGLPAPNVDLPLGALAWSLGAPPDAGHTLFTVARLAGWIAHYLEELAEPPLRFRARAVYAAPRTVPAPPPT